MRSLLVTLLVVAGCAKSEPAERVDPGLVRLSTDRVVKTGSVGEGKWETAATYLLVDAQNASERDLLVTLRGTLVDAAGADVAPLRAESLFIPRGGTRTFALVDDANQARPSATDAKVEVIGAMVPRWKPKVTLSQPNIFDDRGKVIIAANVTNDADRPGKVIVFAGFHDADGRPMARQFELLEMGAGITQVVRFVGPEGSRKGYLFLGDAVY